MNLMKCSLSRIFLSMLVIVFFGNSLFAQKLSAQQLAIKMLDSAAAFNKFNHLLPKNIEPFFVSQNLSVQKFYKKPQGVVTSSETAAVTAGTAYCYDTSGRFFLKTDTTTYYVENTIRLNDGNLLISGQYIFNTSFHTGGFVIKSDEWGNIIWSKLYDPENNGPGDYISYYRTIELKDGSILLAGSTYNAQSENDDLIVSRTDNLGNIIWSKIYKSRLWGHGNGSTDYFYIQQIKQDAYGGDIFFTGPHWADGRSLTRLNVENGNIVWSKLYQIWSGNQFDTPFGIDIKANEIISFGKFLTYYGTPFVNIYRFDKSTGDTLETKFFGIDDTAGYKVGFLQSDPLKKLSNGNYVISGSVFGAYQYNWDGSTPLYQGGMAEFDSNLNFIKAYSFKNSTESNMQNTNITIYPDGSGLFSMLHFISGYTADVFYTQFKNGQVLKQRIRHYSAEGIPITYDALRLQDGGDLTVKLIGDSIGNVNKIEFLKLHIADTASACLGEDDNSTFMQPYKLKQVFLGFDSVGINVFQENPNKTVSVKSTNFDLLPGCKTIAHCDTVSIVPSNTTICTGQPLTLTIRKNAACGAIPFFNYDSTSVNSFNQQNDSVFNLSFTAPWKGYIHASISTCITVKDSVLITVLPSPGKPDLGTDTVLCPGNTIKLNAGYGYASYLWQDGSEDSIYTVTQPGKYYITTTNGCGNLLSDTVIVAPHPPIPFDIGPDISLCSGDTAAITAPPGFISYQWSPAYNITGANTATAILFPFKDTLYKIAAEQTPGCFAYDSIAVTVKHTPVISLGADTSFCIGQSIQLNAGAGFDLYQWNTGEATQKITVLQPGTFSIKAFANGCSAADTLTVTNVFPLPSFTLGSDTILCEHNQLDYSFNLPQAVYNWSTGSTLGNAVITQPGTYWLTVIQQGCSATDTVLVTYNTAPVVNLGNDTTLCENIIKMLNASYNNATYRWQDGSTASGYLVKLPGLYYVTTSIGNCSSSDSINISYKPVPFFTLGNDVFLCTGQQLILSPTLNTNVDYLWQNASTQPSFTINTDGIYTLTTSNECGSYTDSVKITTGICNLNLPNAFTPNKDGLNDLFRVKYPFPVKQFNMAIFNRWGQKIFESADITRGWDGTYKGSAASMDTYTWMISLTDAEGKKQQAHGTVTLIR